MLPYGNTGGLIQAEGLDLFPEAFSADAQPFCGPAFLAITGSQYLPDIIFFIFFYGIIQGSEAFSGKGTGGC